MTESESTPPEPATIEHLHVPRSVYYAVQEPENDYNEAPALLLATHGYGQSCKGFIRNFTPFREQNVLVVAPQAPNQFYWQQSPPKVGFSWMTSYMRENSIADNILYIETLMKTLQERYHFDPAKVFCLGFSQGTAMAFRTAASHVVEPAGLIACASDMPPDVKEQLAELTKFPVLIVHGSEDQSYTIDKAHESEAALKENGFKVDTLFFEGAHVIRREEVTQMVDWIEHLMTSA